MLMISRVIMFACALMLSVPANAQECEVKPSKEEIHYMNIYNQSAAQIKKVMNDFKNNMLEQHYDRMGHHIKSLEFTPFILTPDARLAVSRMDLETEMLNAQLYVILFNDPMIQHWQIVHIVFPKESVPVRLQSYEFFR